jgi:hypothetical protein
VDDSFDRIHKALASFPPEEREAILKRALDLAVEEGRIVFVDGRYYHPDNDPRRKAAR